MTVDDDLALAPTITESVPPGDPLLGATLDQRYRILHRLAAGSSTILYRGVQLSIDRQVAIKVVRGEQARDPATAKRFIRQAKILTALSHPNVVSILDSGHTEAGQRYLVLELLRGTTLEAELARNGRFDARRTCEVGIQLCSALIAVHSLGIVHRDLTLSNVMLLRAAAVRDLVKLLGFGLARPSNVTEQASRLTVPGSIIGTPRYIAPEATFSTDSIDPRSDLYSLGCVLCHLLAGRSDASPQLPSDVSPSLASIVMPLLADAPEQRPAPSLVRQQLQAWLEEQGAFVMVAGLKPSGA